MWGRRTIWTLLTVLLMAGVGWPVSAAKLDHPLPVIFVHGDSDTAGLWIAQIWRFESNGYPRDRLFAIDLDHPGAGSDDNVREENRSTTTDVAAQLAGFVARVMLQTGSDKVVLVGNSRGCSTIRNYVQNAGGAPNAALLVLTGCVNHGVYAAPGVRMGSEYNGAGTFLSKLNAVFEVVPGLTTVTLRSDRFDKYAQPTGEWIGQPGKPTGISYDAPELRGAMNIVLPGVDHRETAYSPAAFVEMHKVVAGHAPATTEIAAEDAPILDGEVSGWANARPTNLPLVGAKLAVYATNAETGERLGDPVHEKVIGADGRWGPFEAKPDQPYEFVIEAEGYSTHHIYRSAFPRASDVVNLRLYPAAEAPDGTAVAVGMMRPRGYFGGQRDEIEFNGEPAPGIPDSEVPGVWKTTFAADTAEPQTVVGRFNGETIAARTWPAAENHVVWIELTH